MPHGNPRALFDQVEAAAQQRKRQDDQRLAQRLQLISGAPPNPNGPNQAPPTPQQAVERLVDQIQRLVSVLNGQRISDPGIVQARFKQAAARARKRTQDLMRLAELPQAKRQALQDLITDLEAAVLRAKGQVQDVLLDNIKDLLGVEQFARTTADVDPAGLRLLLQARDLIEGPLARIDRVRAGIEMARQIIIREREAENQAALLAQLKLLDSELQQAKREKNIARANDVVKRIFELSKALRLGVAQKGQEETSSIRKVAEEFAAFLLFSFGNEDVSAQVSTALSTAANAFSDLALYALIEERLNDALQIIPEGDAQNAVIIAKENIRDVGLIALLPLQNFVAVVGDVAVPLRSASTGDLIVPSAIAEVFTIAGLVSITRELGIDRTPTFFLDGANRMALVPRAAQRLTEEAQFEVAVRMARVMRLGTELLESAPEDMIKWINLYLSATDSELSPVAYDFTAATLVEEPLSKFVVTPLGVFEDRASSVTTESVLVALGFPPDAIQAVLPKIRNVVAIPSTQVEGRLIVTVTLRQSLTPEEKLLFSGASLVPTDRVTVVKLVQTSPGQIIPLQETLAPDDVLTINEYLNKFMTRDQRKQFEQMEEKLVEILEHQAEVVAIFDRTGIPGVAEFVKVLFGQMNRSLITAVEWTSPSQETIRKLIDSGGISTPSIPALIIAENFMHLNTLQLFIRDFASKASTQEGILTLRDWGVLTDLSINKPYNVTFFEPFNLAKETLRQPAIRVGADVLFWIAPLTVLRLTGGLARVGARLTRPAARLLTQGVRQVSGVTQRGFRFAGSVLKERAENAALRRASSGLKATLEGQQIPVDVVYIALRQAARSQEPAQAASRIILWADVLGRERVKSLLAETFLRSVARSRVFIPLVQAALITGSTGLDISAEQSTLGTQPQSLNEPTIQHDPSDVLAQIEEEFLEKNPGIEETLDTMRANVERENLFVLLFAQQALLIQNMGTTGTRGNSQTQKQGSTPPAGGVPESVIIPVPTPEPEPIPPTTPAPPPPPPPPNTTDDVLKKVENEFPKISIQIFLLPPGAQRVLRCAIKTLIDRGGSCQIHVVNCARSLGLPPPAIKSEVCKTLEEVVVQIKTGRSPQETRQAVGAST